VGPHCPHPITFMVSFKDLTFCASGSQILIYERAKFKNKLTPMDCDADIDQLMLFGDLILALYRDNCIRIWDFTTLEFINTLGFSSSFTATQMIHPSTYLNKILVASQQGSMQLWNIRTMTLVYEFSQMGSPITHLCQAPLVDVIAIGLLDGSIHIHDIKTDQEIMRFKQQGKVTALSFRTGTFSFLISHLFSLDGQSIMASANMQGDVTFWDLEQRRLFYILKGAHDASVHSCAFYPNQPILVTASADNSLKMWIFDSLDGIPRLLRSRSGHHKPPSRIRFYSSDGKVLLSSGRDQSLRLFSMIKDAQNTELSQGSLEKKQKKFQVSMDQLKLPLILDFDACETRAKEWDNILTCHSSDTRARLWSFKKKALGSHVLESMDGSPIKATAMSACGHFGFIGSAQGQIDKYNVQSGLYRGSYKGTSRP